MLCHEDKKTVKLLLLTPEETAYYCTAMDERFEKNLRSIISEVLCLVIDAVNYMNTQL
jgi:hypothetical protein